MNKGVGIFILVFLYILLPNQVLGQKMWAGRLMVGGSFLNLSGVDDVLTPKGHSPVGNNFLTIGVGYEQFFNRVSFGIDSYNFMVRGDYNYQDYFRPQVNYHYLLAKTGFVLFREEGEFMIYPTAGIGGGRVGARLVDLEEGKIIREAAFGGLAEFALNARKYTLLEGETPYHMEIGLSLGYLMSLGNDWKLVGLTNDSSGMVAGPDGVFFRLTLGISKWQGM